ncbi:glycosyltransferase family 2 protein, partial [bacterium]|nr:glycosyltransferase family 2 protein [bacterium]
VIIPVFNEEENIASLYHKLKSVLSSFGKDYEIIFVDDGSMDESFKILESLAKEDEKVKVIGFRRNFGQTAALAAGFDAAKGTIIIPMDADLQNDPEDIPHLVEKIKEGCDVVSGWRRKRKDAFFRRRLPSLFANKLISWMTGVYLHDYGCTLKAYRAEAIKDIRLYGEMHRFLPALVFWQGAKVGEIEVKHHARKHGRSKYGLFRTFKVLLDLITVKFLGSFSTKPSYVFGGIGLFLFFCGMISGITVFLQKIFLGSSMIQSPLLHLTALLITLSILFVLNGLLAELSIRTYHESQGKPTYLIRQTINLE